MLVITTTAYFYSIPQLTLFPRFSEPLETDLRDVPLFNHLFTPEETLELGDCLHVGVVACEVPKQSGKLAFSLGDLP